MPDRIVGARRVHDGWLALDLATVELDGTEVEREIVVHPSGAAVLAFDPHRRVAVLVRQTRPPLLREGAAMPLEAVAGALDGDAPEACARREACEEAGLALDTLEPVGAVWMTPATSIERVHLFLAPYAAEDRVAPGGGLSEEQEELRVIELPLRELGRMLDAGTLDDAKTLILAQALRLRRPHLFD